AHPHLHHRRGRSEQAPLAQRHQGGEPEGRARGGGTAHPGLGQGPGLKPTTTQRNCPDPAPRGGFGGVRSARFGGPGNGVPPGLGIARYVFPEPLFAGLSRLFAPSICHRVRRLRSRSISATALAKGSAMTTIAKTAIISLCALVVWLPTSLLAQANLKDRVQGAVDAVESSCAADIGRFCGNLTRGEGRLLLCMQAFDDQLSRRCQFALYRASRNLERALDRVERIADACWTEIEGNCANADRIGQCLVEKTQSLSASCRSVVDGVRQTLQNLAAL